MMHSRYRAPASMTAGVSEKKPISVGPRGISTSMNAAHAKEENTVIRTPLRTRSICFAPIFWPT